MKRCRVQIRYVRRQREMDRLICGDCLETMKTLESESVHCCVTSPPYWGLRDYGVDGQLGLEKTPEEYVEKLVAIFREVKRVLRDDGTLWLNLGDSYCGKNLVGIPWRVALALQADVWYLRQDIIWHKPNSMPESIRDRCTKAHEYIFLLSKSKRYYYDQDAIGEPFNYPERTYNPDVSNHKTAHLKEQGNRSTSGLHDGRTQYGDPMKGRNKRSVWAVTTKPLKEAHFATFPLDLIRSCILAGTVGVVAKQEGRGYIGIELNPDYCDMARKRIEATPERLI